MTKIRRPSHVEPHTISGKLAGECKGLMVTSSVYGHHKRLDSVIIIDNMDSWRVEFAVTIDGVETRTLQLSTAMRLYDEAL